MTGDMVSLTALLLLLFTGILLMVSNHRANSKLTFEVDYNNNQFLKDGVPFTIVAGEMHYFRIPRYYWRDRLKKLKAAGCNTVTTYVEWSFHEPKPGQYYFNGERNISRFLNIAKQVNLTVILRPGPYICAERDFGGLPAWLLKMNPEMKFRTNDPSYTHFVQKWFRVLLSRIQPYLYGNGGNIIMVQIENEYGSYPENDINYLTWLRDLMNDYIKNDAVLFTTDGSSTELLERGKIPGVLATVDFGTTEESIEEIFGPLRAIQPTGPLVNSELYTGWISYWGRPRAQVETNGIVNTILALLENNASFTMYMFHGGTNFGFTAGSNSEPLFVADITSYDYDAPISEAGDLTPKYMAIRDAILNFFKTPSNLTIPIANEKGDYGNVELHPVCSLFSCPIGIEYKPRNGSVNFEVFGQAYGFMSYSTELTVHSKDPSVLNATIRDRAVVYVNDVEVGTLMYMVIQQLPLPSKYKPGQKLTLLIENLGRRNYGLLSDCTKGIVGEVSVDGHILNNWNIKGYPFSTEDIDVLNKLNYTMEVTFPAVFRGQFTLPRRKQPLDTFISMEDWGKGVVFINGINIGRYWNIGPQVTLYVPQNYLKKYPEANIVTVFELHYSNPSTSVKFVKEPIYLNNYN